MPYSTIEPIREKLKGKFRREKREVDQVWKKYLEEKIGALTVDVSCTLGKTKITGRQLLDMKVEDIIELDQKPTDPITVNVEGLPKFRGYPGEYSKKKAVKIVGRTGKE